MILATTEEVITGSLIIILATTKAILTTNKHISATEATKSYLIHYKKYLGHGRSDHSYTSDLSHIRSDHILFNNYLGHYKDDLGH